MCARGLSPLRVQSTRIFKLFLKFYAQRGEKTFSTRWGRIVYAPCPAAATTRARNTTHPVRADIQSAPTICAFGEGAFHAGTGRADVSAPTERLRRWCVRRDCRGALYMRPAQPPQPPGPGTQRTRFGRIYNPPLRYVRSARVLFMPVPGGPMWASAPTERLRFPRKDGPFHIPYPPAGGAKCTAPKSELCILHAHIVYCRVTPPGGR